MNLISVKTAAARLDASPMTVYRMVYAGQLTGVPIGLGQTKPRIRIIGEELDALIEAKAAAAQSKPVPPNTPRPSGPPADPRPPAAPANPPRAA